MSKHDMDPGLISITSSNTLSDHFVKQKTSNVDNANMVQVEWAWDNKAKFPRILWWCTMRAHRLAILFEDVVEDAAKLFISRPDIVNEPKWTSKEKPCYFNLI